MTLVRAGIREEAWEYDWSSARYYRGLESENPLINDRQWYGTPQDWKKLLKDNPEEIDILRKYFRTGRPLGDEIF